MGLNMRFVNDTGLPDDQVFITFQDPGQTLDATYTDNSKAVAVGRVKKSDVMTESLSLATIGADGLEITNAEGPVVFVSYKATQAHGGFSMGADLSGNDQPSYIGSGGANYSKAYQPFEITCVKGATNGQGNLTNINYFAAPIRIQSYHGGRKGTLLQTRGYYQGTATGTAKLKTKLSALTAGVNSALASVTNDGKILRYIGPSSYGAGTNPYPSFDAYLQSLHSNKVVTTIRNSNAFNTMNPPAEGNLNYNYSLDFTATVGADNTITLKGEITTTITPFGGKPYAGTTYSGASMTISPTIGANTSEAIFNNTIYGQSDPLGSGKGSTTFNSVWETLLKDMKAAGLYLNQTVSDTTYTTTQSLAIGEITTGLLGGFVGSDVVYSGGKGTYSTYDGKAYKDVPSEAWWNSRVIPSPSTLQPNNTFYSGYSEIIFDATDNQVYSIPFSDRFGKGPLMQTQLYDGKVVDTWVVTLGTPLFMVGK